MYSVFWLRRQNEAFILHEQEDKGREDLKLNKEVESQIVRKVTVNGQTQEVGITKKWLVAKGLADSIMRQVLKEMNTLDKKDKDLYGISDSGVKDIKCPIQAIHPIFFYEKPRFLNIFHFTDLHVSMRQKILAKSKARVIEYRVNGKNDDLGKSPHIGGKVSSTSENIISLFTAAGEDKLVDLVCITGDLIDYIRNISLEDGEGTVDFTVKQIWEKVSLEDGYKDRYKDFVDYIAFYTMVVEFYKKHKKPVFAISGNHDCYHEPYGSSPRLDIKIAQKLTNEGIPADHNLTLYEAMVAFGPSYGKLYTEFLDSNFDNKRFRWMYSVLTSLSDFALKLPKQSLIGLEWGDEEDLMWDAPWSAHGIGHLPRSKASITDEQLSIINKAIKWERKNILMTHFTFVSYKDSIPLLPESTMGKIEGKIDTNYGFLSSNHTSDYDLGTFKNNRKTLYEELIYKNKSLQVILTGHSHRRGLYTIVDLEENTFSANKIKTNFVDFDGYSRIKGTKESKSLIIVSDSGGPLPRHNKYGEFKGWGSDRASGTRIVFDQDSGDVEAIDAVKVGAKPRLVVALDYTDLFGKYTVTEIGYHTVEKKKKDVEVFPAAESSLLSEREIKKGNAKVGFPFEVFTEENKDYALEKSFLKLADNLFLYRVADKGNISERYTLKNSNGVWSISDKDFGIFEKHLNKNSKTESWFFSVSYNVVGDAKNKRSMEMAEYIKDRYDISDAWCFECKIRNVVTSGSKKFELSRDKKMAMKIKYNLRETYVIYD